MVTPATEASMMAVGHFPKYTRSMEERTTAKNELAEREPYVFFSYVPFSDDDTERPAEVSLHEKFLLQDTDVNDKVIIIADA